MKILAVDTSLEHIGIGYYDGEKYTKIITTSPKSHNRSLLSEIDLFLQECGVVLNDVDCFAVVVGPGSFTGIRIGVATVNAFAFALNKPVIEITSLEVLAGDGDKMVLLDCKHNNYYVGIFTEEGTEYSCMKKEKTDQYALPKVYLSQTDPEKILDVAIKKLNKKDWSDRAKPFYIKSSSAETGE